MTYAPSPVATAKLIPILIMLQTGYLGSDVPDLLSNIERQLFTFGQASKSDSTPSTLESHDT